MACLDLIGERSLSTKHAQRWFFDRYTHNYVITEALRTRLFQPALLEAFISISDRTMPKSLRYEIWTLALGSRGSQYPEYHRSALVKLWVRVRRRFCCERRRM